MIIICKQATLSNYSIDIMIRVFTNDPGDQGSVPDQVIPKTQKMVLDAPCLTLSIIRYKSRVSGAIQERNSTLPTSWFDSY